MDKEDRHNVTNEDGAKKGGLREQNDEEAKEEE